MLQTRVIPCLLLSGQTLVKTVQFKRQSYIGDPVNTVRIFNELEVDELIFLDVNATPEGREPPYETLAQIAEECFMPLAYGGGITSVEIADRLFSIGIEKIAVNSRAHEDPGLITRLSDRFGAQAVIGSIDVKQGWLGRKQVCSRSAREKHRLDPVSWALRLEELGAGEILLTSVDREGTWSGFDLRTIKEVTEAVNVPVIAHGGAGSIDDISAAVFQGGASAVALGSMVVYQGKDLGVLVNFPDRKKLTAALERPTVAAT